MGKEQKKYSNESLKQAPGGLLAVKDGQGNAGVGSVAGWATTAMPDQVNDIIAHGAFAESITEKGITGPAGIQFLIGHDWDKPAGVITKLEYRPKGLWIEADLDLNISWAKDMYYAAKSRGGLSFSVGFRAQTYYWYENEDDGEEYFIIQKAMLREVSVVANPCNVDAIMEWVKSEDSAQIEPEEKEVNWLSTGARTHNIALFDGAPLDPAEASRDLLKFASLGKKDFDAGFCRRVFLLSDEEKEDTASSYLIPLGQIKDGKFLVSRDSIDQAEAALKSTKLSEKSLLRAEDIIKDYRERFDAQEKNLTDAAFRQALVSEGLVKTAEAAEMLFDFVKSHLQLFAESEPQAKKSSLSVDTVTRATEALNRMRRDFLNSEKED